MNSKRRTYFKSYMKNSNSADNQEPQVGTSKKNDSKLSVVRKLMFKTPKKLKDAQRTKKTSLNTNNKSTQKSELSEPVILSNADEQTTVVVNNIQQIYDLTNEGGEREEDNYVFKKEAEIFREIARQHEIEEAIHQIHQEDSDNCDGQNKMDINEFNLETKSISPNFNIKNSYEILNEISLEEKNPIDLNKLQGVNFTGDKCKNQMTETEVQMLNDTQVNIFLQNNLRNMDEKFGVSKSAMDLKCIEDFKEIDTIDFQKNEEATFMTAFKIDKTNDYIKENSTNLEKREENQKDNEDKCITFDDIIKSAIASEENGTQSLLTLAGDEKNFKDDDSYMKDSNNEPDLNLHQGEQMANYNRGDAYVEKKETLMHKKIKRDEYLKNKHLRQQKRQKYVDFMSDNEDFVWSSSSWEASSSESSESEVVKKKIKKITQNKKHSNSASKSTDNGRTGTISKAECSASAVAEKKKQRNIRKETKRKRETGKEYTTKKGHIVPAKDMKPNPCSLNNCTNKCYEINEEKRKSLFVHFWSLDSVRRKDWLVSHSKKLSIKRHRSSDKSSRTNTFHYFINEGEGQRQVCQQFLICALDIKQKTLYNTVVNSLHGSASEDMRGKHVPKNKTPDTVIENLRKYIQELPALPSHYCRKNSKRTYLPQEFRNITNLYRIYKENQEKNGLLYVGEKVFKKVFTSEFNIGFHFPRKDKCLKCTQFENDKNFNEEEKLKHLKDKEETTERFKAHQDIHNKDKTILCTTFDLQKVLNTPHGENMMLYYSRKLAVYNLTFYESGTRNGFCYTWSEIDGKRGANEVSSILQKYINEVDQRGTIKHLLLYCDSCPGQNKNKTVLACINVTLQKCNSLLSIQINYLLPGHTYMPVDSVHSVIEKSLGGIIIWAPSQWSTVFTLARKSPKPYEVEVLQYNDFNKWDMIADKYFKGNLSGKISKLRTVTFKKSTTNMCYVKFSMNPDAEIEQIEITKKNDAVQLKPCYKALLPVSKKKYMDLNKLCTNKVIPVVYHEEYKRLSYANIQDYLIDTDEEDEETA